jgi:ferredoxin
LPIFKGFMSIEITFEPDGLTGLVAEGSNLWDTAKRMGVRLPSECAGRGECDTCALTVYHGASLLSPVTDAERTHLTDARRASGERLACQTQIVGSGEVKVRIAPEVEKAEENIAKFRRNFGKLELSRKMAFVMELEKALITRSEVPIKGDDVEAEYRREFNQLPFNRKLAALAELEGASAIHGVLDVANLPFTIGEKVMDVMAVRGRRMDQKTETKSKEE